MVRNASLVVPGGTLAAKSNRTFCSQSGPAYSNGIKSYASERTQEIGQLPHVYIPGSVVPGPPFLSARIPSGPAGVAGLIDATSNVSGEGCARITTHTRAIGNRRMLKN